MSHYKGAYQLLFVSDTATDIDGHGTLSVLRRMNVELTVSTCMHRVTLNSSRIILVNFSLAICFHTRNVMYVLLRLTVDGSTEIYLTDIFIIIRHSVIIERQCVGLV